MHCSVSMRSRQTPRIWQPTLQRRDVVALPERGRRPSLQRHPGQYCLAPACCCPLCVRQQRVMKSSQPPHCESSAPVRWCRGLRPAARAAHRAALVSAPPEARHPWEEAAQSQGCSGWGCWTDPHACKASATSHTQLCDAHRVLIRLFSAGHGIAAHDTLIRWRAVIHPGQAVFNIVHLGAA